MEGTSPNSTPGSIVVKPGLHLLPCLVTWAPIRRQPRNFRKTFEFREQDCGAKTELSVFHYFGLIQLCARGEHIN